jgi:hypothetical protein
VHLIRCDFVAAFSVRIWLARGNRSVIQAWVRRLVETAHARELCDLLRDEGKLLCYLRIGTLAVSRERPQRRTAFGQLLPNRFHDRRKISVPRQQI